jgi:hypothetical protein
MSKYFTNYPTIEYQGKQIRDITKRSKIRNEILSDPLIFLPFTVRDGEKPETIAQLYYGSVDDTWLVLFANNMTDPYYDWPMSDEEFDQYFIDKYSELSGKTGYDVIRWGQNETIRDNIVYYYKEVDKSIGDADPVFSSRRTTSYVDVTDEQLEQILDNQVVTIDGIQYRLVKE